ncbi:uncharacterized protein KY384_005472 [Bacidia gigantensis]|uniref:uncharacterized protein n=1 Tax=Bacidia gigantensis TaxID=2732470 RepID=UPI001D0566C1|nr:uncharacterized protein KY384_005472 [Bacidia gigantensis]KAG8529990.1 hypothetical protein KY384_005472 [Bacidia gigantensis]
MTSHGSRPSERGYHQDYIARIRYENTLPPPPGAPKLLNIPIEGLNYYTSAAFASRMARQQPLNIEADAELGMPIDLVGMPGIFDGDESSIQAPLAIPAISQKDKSLLRPLSELGKPKFATGAHSFLRRTEYISSEAKARAEAHTNTTKGSSKSPTAKLARRQSDAVKDDPVNILRHVIKGFDIASPRDVYTGKDDTSHLRGAQPTPAEIEAWKRPRHPTNPELKLLDSYAIKPDADATTDQGAYIVTKFVGNPTNSSSAHDIRMDVGLLNPVERNGDAYDYEFYLPQEAETARRVKRKFEEGSTDDDDKEEEQRDKDGNPLYKFHHHRTYDVGRQTNSLDQPYKEVVIALHDANQDARLDTGAFYYPVGIKMQLKPRRNKNLANLGLTKEAADDETERPDEINLILRDPDDEEVEKRWGHRQELFSQAPAVNGS